MAEQSVIRELVTLLGFDIDEKTLALYELRINQARRALRAMTIAAGIAGAAITALAVKTARMGDTLLNTSRRLGLGVVALQEWFFAAEKGGITAQAFDMAIQRFGRRAAEAAQGTGEAVRALAELQIQTRDANGNVREMGELLEDAVKALADLENPLRRNRLAFKLFDSEGVKVVQMLHGGSEALQAARKRLNELGGVMDEQTAQLGKDAVNAWTDFSAAMNGVIFAMGKHLLPTITKLLLIVSKFLSKNQQLVTVLAFVTIGITALTAVVLGAVTVWKLWGAAVALVNTGLVLAVAKAGLLVALFAALVLFAEDIGLFFRGGADTLTGRMVDNVKRAAVTVIELVKSLAVTFVRETLPAAIKSGLSFAIDSVLPGVGDQVVTMLERAIVRAIEFWKRLALDFLGSEMPSKVTSVIDKAMAHFSALWTKFVGVIASTLRFAIESAIPPAVLELLKLAPGASRFGLGGDPAAADKARLGAAAQRLAQPAAGGTTQTIGDININVTQAPGESSSSVVKSIAEFLIGKHVINVVSELAP